MGHGDILDHRCAPFPFCPHVPFHPVRVGCDVKNPHKHARSMHKTGRIYMQAVCRRGHRTKICTRWSLENLICLSSGIQTDRDASPTIKQGGLRIVPQPGRHSSVRTGGLKIPFYICCIQPTRTLESSNKKTTDNMRLDKRPYGIADAPRNTASNATPDVARAAVL